MNARYLLPSMLLLAGCGDFFGGAPSDPTVTPSIVDQRASACQGFEAGGESLFSNGTDSVFPGSYCDAEVLHWQYDATAQKLSLVDSRAELNCCGVHTMAGEHADGTYVLTETDAPEEGGGRCYCLCVFDFGVDLENVPAGLFKLRLTRLVTDSEAPASVLWEGELDLSAGAGWVVLTTDFAYECEEIMTGSRTSECGGFTNNGEPVIEGDPLVPENYCNAEVLYWHQGAGSDTLSLTDTRVQLNCCGVHSTRFSQEGETYIMTEIDAPEDNERCNCVCVFDFSATGAVPAGLVDFELRRWVTDEASAPTTVWQGQLDLTAGSGSVTVDTRPVALCE